ncbi:MAG: hypothetical protein AAB263_22200 [Planctomycetota bacterium]
MIRSAFLTPLLVLVAGSTTAAELVVRDVRVGLDGRPLAYSFSLTSNAGQASGNDAFQSALALEAGGRWSYARAGDSVGLIVGADVMLDGWSNSGGGGMATTWVRASVGPGWAINDRWTAMAEVGMQYGFSGLKMPASATSPAFTATGAANGYDLRLGATWLASRQFGIGGHVGWLVTSHDVSGDNVHLTIKQSGWFVGIEAVWRFSDVPSRLE